MADSESEDLEGYHKVDFIISSRLEVNASQTKSRGKRAKAAPPIWKYRVRWEGYGPSDDTWEPAESFEGAEHFIQTFWKCADTGGRDWKDVLLFTVWEEFTPDAQRLAEQKIADAQQAEVNSSEARLASVDLPDKPAAFVNDVQDNTHSESKNLVSTELTEALPEAKTVSSPSPFGTVLKLGPASKTQTPIVLEHVHDIIKDEKMIGSLRVASYSREHINDLAFRDPTGDFHEQTKSLPETISSFVAKVFDRAGSLRDGLRDDHMYGINKSNFILVRHLSITGDAMKNEPGIRAHTLSQLKELAAKDGRQTFIFIPSSILFTLEQLDNFPGFFAMHGFCPVGNSQYMACSI